MQNNNGNSGMPVIETTKEYEDSFKVLRICDAYESGIGHGDDDVKKSNSYPYNTPDYDAYDLGITKRMEMIQEAAMQEDNRRKEGIIPRKMVFIDELTVECDECTQCEEIISDSKVLCLCPEEKRSYLCPKYRK
jgi:hypothetical protein